jgi:hypothetical protein
MIAFVVLKLTVIDYVLWGRHYSLLIVRQLFNFYPGVPSLPSINALRF